MEESWRMEEEEEWKEIYFEQLYLLNKHLHHQRSTCSDSMVWMTSLLCCTTANLENTRLKYEVLWGCMEGWKKGRR